MNIKKLINKKVIRIASNKFLLVGVVFLVWMMLFDQNDWMSQREKNKELKNSKENITYLNSEIDRMEDEFKELTTNPQKLEKYARETYRMKRDSEDLFVVERK
jgi:cell division protein FtsB